MFAYLPCRCAGVRQKRHKKANSTLVTLSLELSHMCPSMCFRVAAVFFKRQLGSSQVVRQSRNRTARNISVRVYKSTPNIATPWDKLFHSIALCIITTCHARTVCDAKQIILIRMLLLWSSRQSRLNYLQAQWGCPIEWKTFTRSNEKVSRETYGIWLK